MTQNATPVEAKPVEPALVRQEPPAQALAQQSLTPMQMISSIVQGGADPNALDRVTAWAERMEANQARKEYANAIVHFQALCPVIIRTGFNTRFGNQYPQWSTAHPQIKSALDTAQLATTHLIRQDEKGLISVIGQVRHGPSGHIEEICISAPPDRLSSKEGKLVRNEVQAIKSTITYLEWLTMECLLGLKSRDRKKGEGISETLAVMVDHDDDGGNRAGESPEPPKPQSPADPEAEIKKEFWNACQSKAGARFTAAQVRAIFASVQEVLGNESAAACLAYIHRDTVAIGADGTVVEAVPPPADSTDADPFGVQTPAAAETASDPVFTSRQPPSFPPFVCLTCGFGHSVRPGGGKCIGREGQKCKGEVVPNSGTWVCKAGHSFRYDQIKANGAAPKGICPVCDSQGKIMAGIEPVR